MLAQLIIAHLIGDFLLQNHWMQRKAQSSFVCSVHVACYAIPFAALCSIGNLKWVVFVAIIVQHWLQDRYSLHLKWMQFYRQTPPDKWTVGPLCVDQAFHLAFIGLFASLSK